MNEPLDGLLVLDKPRGMTSRAAVDGAMRWFPRKTKIGHTGTLDPLATGVLVLCLGSATRLVEYVQHMGKTYRVGILLGARSDTDDADGTIIPEAAARVPSTAEVSAALAGFLGPVLQVPPSHSAAKVSGPRAYDLARRGEEVNLASRTVMIEGIDILLYEWPRLDLEVRCGKGTYIRSLARDLGERLGCGGLVETLRRTRIGPFTPEQAVSLESDTETARHHLLPAALAVGELPGVRLAAAELRRFRQGQAVAWEQEINGAAVAIFNEAGALQGVAAVEPGTWLLRPAKVF